MTGTGLRQVADIPRSLIDTSVSTAAFAQLPGGWWLSNCGVVAGTDGVLLVDTCATNARTRAFLDLVAERYGNRRIAGVVNTHAHGDHTYGNHLVGTVPIYATAATCRLAERTGLARWRDVFVQPDWGEQELVVPTVEVGARYEVDLGGVRAELHPAPGPAHTVGDLVVWVPRDRVLFSGDLVFHGVTPVTVFGSVAGWLSTVDWLLDRFDAAVVVPGHGRIGDGRALRRQRDYLHWLWDSAHRLAGCAMDDPSIVRVATGCPFSDWSDSDRNLPNLRATVQELAGLPVDLASIVARYVRANGGLIDCLA